MIGKILNSTRGRPCSCPAGKECTKCIKKNQIPQAFVEEPKHVSIISHYRQKPQTTIKIVDETKHHYRKKPFNRYMKKPFKFFKRSYQKKERSKREGICKWYKRKKALKELKKMHEREMKEREKLAQIKREEEFLVQLQKQTDREEKERHKLEQEVYTQLHKKRSERKIHTPSPRTEKAYYVKEKPLKIKSAKARSTYVKPRAATRYVTVNRCARDSLTHRFVEWFYRLCCEFYCCLTLILIIGLAIFLLT